MREVCEVPTAGAWRLPATRKPEVGWRRRGRRRPPTPTPSVPCPASDFFWIRIVIVADHLIEGGDRRVPEQRSERVDNQVDHIPRTGVRKPKFIGNQVCGLVDHRYHLVIRVSNPYFHAFRTALRLFLIVIDTKTDRKSTRLNSSHQI